MSSKIKCKDSSVMTELVVVAAVVVDKRPSPPMADATVDATADAATPNSGNGGATRIFWSSEIKLVLHNFHKISLSKL